MPQTIYAAFENPVDAERAAGALLDHGVRAEDLTILANETYATTRAERLPEEYQGGPARCAGEIYTDSAVVQTDVEHRNPETRVRIPEEEARDAEHTAEEGITTTSAGDAASGAAKGAGIGLGVGILATLATMTVPGIGIVIGGGALATAIGATAATAAAGAVAGGVTGYLKDQGVAEEHVAHYADTFGRGGAIVAVHIPSGDVDRIRIEQILTKYSATAVRSYAA